MSRCFSYPPPGYHRKKATYEALIESIKLQKKTDKTKAERKKEKKTKKEQKEKKQKDKRNNEVKLKNNPNDYTEVQVKVTKPAIELLERSDLSEEHGQPISQHQPSYSSDSTQNSNKRKQDNASLQQDCSTGHGKPIKIRLLKKHKELDATMISDTTKNRLHFGRQMLPEVPSSSGSRNASEHRLNSTIPVNGAMGPCNGDSTNKGPQKVGPTRLEKKRLKKHAKYEKLMGSWLAPVIEGQLLGVDGEDWLSRRKVSSSSNFRGEVETCRELVVPWQPCARFVADVDIHVMPYTVPF